MADTYEIDMNSVAYFKKMTDKIALAGVSISSIMATMGSAVNNAVKTKVNEQLHTKEDNKPIGDYLSFSTKIRGNAKFIHEVKGGQPGVKSNTVSYPSGFNKGTFLLVGRKRGIGKIRPRNKKALKFRTNMSEGGPLYGSTNKSAVQGVSAQVGSIAADVIRNLVTARIADATGLGPRGGSRRVTTGGRFTGGTGRGVRARDRATEGPGIEVSGYKGARG